jgi:hypothetical protein
MKGDYYRYIAEYAEGELKEKVRDASFNAYQEAFDYSKELSPISPIVLDLTLNSRYFITRLRVTMRKPTLLPRRPLIMRKKNY